MRWPLVIGVAAGALIALVVGGLVWAQTYEPLEVTSYRPGQGMGGKVEAGDFGLQFVARAKTPFVEVEIDVRNAGSLPVTIDRAVPDGPTSPLPGEQRGAWFGAFDLASGTVRIPAHATRRIVVRAQGRCYDRSSGGMRITRSGISLHYRYGRVFNRTQIVGWPFGAAYAC